MKIAFDNSDAYVLKKASLGGPSNLNIHGMRGGPSIFIARQVKIEERK